MFLLHNVHDWSSNQLPGAVRLSIQSFPLKDTQLDQLNGDNLTSAGESLNGFDPSTIAQPGSTPFRTNISIAHSTQPIGKEDALCFDGGIQVGIFITFVVIYFWQYFFVVDQHSILLHCLPIITSQ